jgi:elongator complex protein 1
VRLTISREEDVSQTLYKDTLKALNVGVAVNTGLTKSAKKGGKVNRICDGFLAALEKRSDSNLHNLITAHVCKLPPDLESGLRLVARLRGLS